MKGAKGRKMAKKGGRIPLMREASKGKFGGESFPKEPRAQGRRRRFVVRKTYP